MLSAAERRQGAVPDWSGPGEEAADRRFSGREPGEPRVRPAQALFRRRSAGGRLRLCVAAVLRFLRLHRYRPRLRASARHHAAAQFQSAVRRPKHFRLLASLAHFLLQLAARLSVFLAARPALALENLRVSESGHHHDDRRPLARRELDVSDLGRLARRRPRGAPRVADPARKSQTIDLHACGRASPRGLLTFHFVLSAGSSSARPVSPPRGTFSIKSPRAPFPSPTSRRRSDWCWSSPLAAHYVPQALV